MHRRSASAFLVKRVGGHEQSQAEAGRWWKSGAIITWHASWSALPGSQTLPTGQLAFQLHGVVYLCFGVQLPRA